MKISGLSRPYKAYKRVRILFLVQRLLDRCAKAPNCCKIFFKLSTKLKLPESRQPQPFFSPALGLATATHCRRAEHIRCSWHSKCFSQHIRTTSSVGNRFTKYGRIGNSIRDGAKPAESTDHRVNGSKKRETNHVRKETLQIHCRRIAQRRLRIRLRTGNQDQVPARLAL